MMKGLEGFTFKTQFRGATQLMFSERELMFTFAVCYRPSVCRLSVCLSSVTFVRRTQAVEIFGISAALSTSGIH